MENDTDESELLISFFFFIIFVKIDVFLAVLIKYTFFFCFLIPPYFCNLGLKNTFTSLSLYTLPKHATLLAASLFSRFSLRC